MNSKRYNDIDEKWGIKWHWTVSGLMALNSEGSNDNDQCGIKGHWLVRDIMTLNSEGSNEIEQ